MAMVDNFVADMFGNQPESVIWIIHATGTVDVHSWLTHQP